MHPQVLHMKNQIDVGLGVCERLMERRLFVVRGPQGQNVAQLQRKVLQDSSQKGFDSTTLEKMHHLGIIDIPKMGRLTAPDVQDISDWTYKVLAWRSTPTTAAELRKKISLLSPWNNKRLNLYPRILTDLSVSPTYGKSGCVFMIAPLLAGEGTLGGLRGEYRSFGLTTAYCFYFLFIYIQLYISIEDKTWVVADPLEEVGGQALQQQYGDEDSSGHLQH